MKAPLTYQEYDKKGLRLFPSQIKDLYEQIQQLKEAHNTLRNHTQSLEDEVKQLKEQRHRKNMLIENLKKQTNEFKRQLEVIIGMTNVHGLYKDDTDCVDSIRDRCIKALKV